MEKVTSREYKVMLHREAFTGDTNQLVDHSLRFWEVFTNQIQDFIDGTKGTFVLQKRRLIRFYDTEGCFLHKNAYVFRKRTLIDDTEPEVTLKFRHPDRYVAADRKMDSDEAEAEIKFEQDIKPPFIPLYSFSSTIPDPNNWSYLAHVEDLYPDLAKQLPNHQGASLYQVGDFTAREYVVSEAKLAITTDPKVTAKCALVVWYDEAGSHETPEVVEFSFRYKDKKKQENYPGIAALRAYNIFRTLQQMKAYDPDSMTKTRFVYNKENCQPSEHDIVT
jgi:hypothetical protein